jgi:hypothetical protein
VIFSAKFHLNLLISLGQQCPTKSTLITGIVIIRTHEMRKIRKQNLLDTYILYIILSIPTYHEDLVGSHFLFTRSESRFRIGFELQQNDSNKQLAQERVMLQDSGQVVYWT